jgi:hypothetical protein
MTTNHLNTGVEPTPETSYICTSDFGQWPLWCNELHLLLRIRGSTYGLSPLFENKCQYKYERNPCSRRECGNFSRVCFVKIVRHIVSRVNFSRNKIHQTEIRTCIDHYSQKGKWKLNWTKHIRGSSVSGLDTDHSFGEWNLQFLDDTGYVSQRNNAVPVFRVSQSMQIRRIARTCHCCAHFVPYVMCLFHFSSRRMRCSSHRRWKKCIHSLQNFIRKTRRKESIWETRV